MVPTTSSIRVAADSRATLPGSSLISLMRAGSRASSTANSCLVQFSRACTLQRRIEVPAAQFEVPLAARGQESHHGPARRVPPERIGRRLRLSLGGWRIGRRLCHRDRQWHRNGQHTSNRQAHTAR